MRSTNNSQILYNRELITSIYQIKYCKCCIYFFRYIQYLRILIKRLTMYHKTSYQSMQKYPEDITCIIDPINDIGAIYIGNLQAAQNLNTLKKFNIEAIITVAAGVRLQHPSTQIIQIKYIPAQDDPSFQITQYIDEAIDFIKQYQKRTNILVHCMAGISRSVSVVIGYLIREYRLTYQQAFYYVKKRRSIISPNEGFIDQLKKYQKKFRYESEEKAYESNKKEGLVQKDLSYLSDNKMINGYFDNKYNTRFNHAINKIQLHSDRIENCKPIIKLMKMSDITFLLNSRDIDRKIDHINKKYQDIETLINLKFLSSFIKDDKSAVKGQKQNDLHYQQKKQEQNNIYQRKNNQRIFNKDVKKYRF